MSQMSAIVGLRGDLLSIHAAQLRFVDRLIEAGHSGARDAALFTGVEAVLALFHSHHGTEEEVVFPEWTAGGKDPVIDRFVAAHRELEAAARNVETALSFARNGGDDAAATDLHQALRAMRALMQTHFKDEETHFTVEKINEVVGEARVAAMAPRITAHAKAHSNPPWLVLPAVFFNLNDAEWATFRHHYPWFLREILVKMIWKPKWKAMTPFFAYPPQ